MKTKPTTPQAYAEAYINDRTIKLTGMGGLKAAFRRWQLDHNITPTGPSFARICQDHAVKEPTK